MSENSSLSAEDARRARPGDPVRNLAGLEAEHIGVGPPARTDDSALDGWQHGTDKPSSDVQGGRLARRGERGGIGSRHMYSSGPSGADVTGLGWTGGAAGSGACGPWSVMSAHGSRLAGGLSWDKLSWPISSPKTTPDTRSCRRARSDVGKAVRAGTMESSVCPNKARSA